MYRAARQTTCTLSISQVDESATNIVAQHEGGKGFQKPPLGLECSGECTLVTFIEVYISHIFFSLDVSPHVLHVHLIEVYDMSDFRTGNF